MYGIASGCKCFFKKPKLCICGIAFLLMDVTYTRNIHERRRQSNGDRSLTHSLTLSILINLFIKLELSNFLLPLVLIVFVQECSVVSQGAHAGSVSGYGRNIKKCMGEY